MGEGEAFVRLTEASTNYVALGEAGLPALTRLVRATPAFGIAYPDSAAGITLVEQALGRGSPVSAVARPSLICLRAAAIRRRLSPRDWDGVIGVARSEAMLATLAHRLEDAALPPAVAALFADQRAAAKVARAQALWEAEMARRALAPAGIEFVLLKGRPMPPPIWRALRVARSAISISSCSRPTFAAPRTNCSTRGGNG